MKLFLSTLLFSSVLAGPGGPPIEYTIRWPNGMDPNACEGSKEVLDQHYTVTINDFSFDLSRNFYPFQYGEAGTFANVNFLVGLGADNREISLQDCYCSGDNFILANFGDPSFTQPSDINIDCELGADCFEWLTDPQACWDSSSYCYQSYKLPKGVYNFSILIINSPYGFGQGFLALEPIQRPG